MIPELYEHQKKLWVDLRVALRGHQAVLAYGPTGIGKTNLSAALIAKLFSADKRVIFAVHRNELLRQTASTFEAFGIPYGYIASGYHHNIYRKVNIASIPTLQNRLGKYPADYVFVDEAHLSASGGWAKTINHYKGTGARIIGLSGSPQRLDGKPLGDVWDTMVLGPSTRWLIENGFLSKYRAFAPAGVDLSGVHTRNGDYVASEIDEIMAGKAVMAGAVRHWRKYAAGKRTIAFAPSIIRSEQLAAQFRSEGIVAVHVDGNTPIADRVAAFQGFADRQIEVLTNCLLWTEGFDLAAQVGRPCTVECVLDYSPTQSVARHLQKYGRGLRADKGAPHVLLDLVGGFSRLGLPDDEREWTLDGKATGAPKSKQEEQVRCCPTCFAAHNPAPICPECGHVYVAATRKINEVEGELVELDQDAMRAARKQEHDQTAASLAAKIKAGNLNDPKLEKEVAHLMNSVVARRSKSPAKWAAHVLTARLAKRASA